MLLAFNWDDGKVMRDPDHIRAADLFMHLEMLIDPDNADQIKKDYESNIQYVKFFKKVNKQVKTEANDEVKGGAKGRKKK